MAEATGLRNNALNYPIYGAPFGVVVPLLDADGDLVTGATSPDSERSLNGDTFADCTNEATEIATSSGMYYLLLTAAEMTADVVAVIIKSGTAGMKTTPLVLYPRKLVTVRSGTSASAGSATSTIVLDGSASAIDDFYNGMVCIATIDGNVEVRVITDYVGSTQTASVSPDWNVAPDNNDTFVIKLPEGVQVIQANVSHIGGTLQTANDVGADVNEILTDTGTTLQAELDGIQADTEDIQSRLPAALVNSRMDATIDGTGLEAAALALINAEVDTALADYDAPTKAELDSAVSPLATAANLATVAGYLDTEIAAILADTNELQTDWVDGGRLDLILDARASQASVDDLPTNAELATSQAAADDATLAAIAALNNLSAAQVNAEVDTALTDIHLDHLLAATYDPASKPGAADALLNELIESDGGVSRFTANALEQAPTGGSAPTAGEIADAVWEEALADHESTVGSTAEALADAGGSGASAADIADAVWDEATSGHTTSGTFGEQLKTDVDAILVDTAEIGAAGAGLTNINLPNQTMDIVGNITGNLSGSVGSVTGAVGSVTAGVTLANDAITAATFDESTAFPVKSNDSGSTQIARVGADGDTLETISDQLDTKASQSSVDDLPTNAELATSQAAADDATLSAIAGLSIPTAVQNRQEMDSNSTKLASIDAQTTNLPASPAATGDIAAALEATIADSIPADGTRPSVKQALYMLTQFMLERSVSSTTVTVNKPDGSTALFTLTIDDATTPTSISRAT